MIGTSSATELESTVLGRLDDEAISEPSDEQIGQIIQEVVAPELFDHVEFGAKSQGIVWAAMAQALARELGGAK